MFAAAVSCQKWTMIAAACPARRSLLTGSASGSTIQYVSAT